MRNFLCTSATKTILIAASAFFIATSAAASENSICQESVVITISNATGQEVVDADLRSALDRYRAETKFETLAREWKSERDTLSWVSDMVACPSYQKIIGMGPAVIPLILARLQAEGNEPDHWFWALRVIADDDPVAEEDQGDIVKMASAWLEWGRQQGHAV